MLWNMAFCGTEKEKWEKHGTHSFSEWSYTWEKKVYCMCKLEAISSTMSGPICVGKQRLGLIFQFLDATSWYFINVGYFRIFLFKWSWVLCRWRFMKSLGKRSEFSFFSRDIFTGLKSKYFPCLLYCACATIRFYKTWFIFKNNRKWSVGICKESKIIHVLDNF